MFVSVNGTKLFVDVEGVGWITDGGTLGQKPARLLRKFIAKVANG